VRLPRNDPASDPAINPQAGDQLVIEGETWTVTGRAHGSLAGAGGLVLTTAPDGGPHPISLSLWQKVATAPRVQVVRKSTDASVRKSQEGHAAGPGKPVQMLTPSPHGPSTPACAVQAGAYTKRGARPQPVPDRWVRAMRRACPLCGAGRGKPCARTKHAGRPHAARLVKAR
jgi:hypothetical protein